MKNLSRLLVLHLFKLSTQNIHLTQQPHELQERKENTWSKFSTLCGSLFGLTVKNIVGLT